VAAVSATSLPHRSPLAQRPGLLRLRSDEALVELFRAGRDDAFDEIVERYRDKLLAHARHVLRGSDEAQDVIQDVFVRAHGALRRNDREMNLRPWLYKIAHNRCMDVLRRPVPTPSEPALEEVAPADTVDQAQQREELRTLVGDISRLPDQQRSALVIRELGGLSYEEMAAVLDTTVPAIKSLLVRARVGLAEAAEARAASCAEVREELAGSRRPSAVARRHAVICADCGVA
jgi:RNA polymerase sigma factor (sigma-70 family)